MKPSTTSILLLGVICASMSLFACSAARDDLGGPGNGLGGSGTPGDPAGGPGDAGGFGGDTAGGDGGDCDEDLKQVFVVTTTNGLYRFEPMKLAFVPIGKVSCPGTFGMPFSMAVDRKGIAWVNMSDGTLAKVSTKDAKCTMTSFKVNQAGFSKFGMAFVSEGSKGETLLVSDYDGKGIATIDTSSLVLTPRGSYGSLGPAELTGTGAAKLFGLFHDTNSVIELDRDTAKVLQTKVVPGLVVGMAWAFAHWGGDFWLFTSPTIGSSNVTQFDWEAGTGKMVKSKLPFMISGAGVSTCAPTTRPK